MTYRGDTTRTTNRMLMALVVITVLVVAFWAINGGLDEMTVAESQQAAVTE